MPPFGDMTDGGQLRHMLSHKEELQVRSDQAFESIRGTYIRGLYLDWRAICSELDKLILQLLYVPSKER